MPTPDLVRPENMEPVFVLGRQHSGNTMLTTVLGRLPGMMAVRGEGGFIEHRHALDGLPPEERAKKTARRIRDDGVRKLFRDEDAGDELEGFWQEVTPEMAAAAEQGADASALYALGMSRVLDRFGASRWVQKGTSYIFVAEDILRVFPLARMIFIARNPLDLAASTKKRNGTGRYTLRVGLGWRRGVRRALAMREALPGQFLIVRYEDLVRAPERIVQDICAFAGLGYDPTCLDIPHVNKADAPYRTKGEAQGLSASRLFYYDTILSQGEQAALRSVVGEAAMLHLYPELLKGVVKASVGGQIGVLAVGALSILAGEATRLARAPAHALARFRNRV